MNDEAEVKKEAAPEVETPEGCNCEEEFITVTCPVHGAIKEEQAGFGDDLIIITDNDLNKEKPFSTYRGHIFDCPKCGKPSIMVNQNMGEFCVACGVKVRVESKVVTDYIRSLE